ncbi:MAG: MlaD family protein [Beijerinckiaceae bacterium]|nr:MlaD family protein [Beijerinckiaceae bacterium]
METRANYALIGAFTLAVLGAAFMFVYWFSQASKEGTRDIKIEFASSVSGLSRGSSVNFNGVRVGEVKMIELSTTRPGVVYANIEVSLRAPVKKDTRARLEYQGLTGVASIALAGGTEDSPPLTGERGMPPVIEADRSDYQNILETLQRLAGRVETVLDNANNLFSENAASIARTVKNVETFSQALGENSDGVKSFMQAMSEIGTSIKPMLANLEGLAKSVESRVEAVDPQKVASILDNADSLAKQLNASAGKLDKLMSTLDGFLGSADSKGVIADVSDAAKSFRKLADNLDVRTKELTAGVNRFTGAGLRQYEALAADGRRTLDEINRTLRSLERNPQQLIFGRKPTTPEYSGR